ncbi:chorismate-binding protein [Flavobacterium sp. RHBU_24]|uniref:chorismate-binding protein n=1 Tax=Flavobacterium sp. RHBU_24 TaxID=3391185 RepID=UPI0039846B35
MTDIFLKLKKQYEAKLPFAVYAKPGSSSLTGVFQTTPETFTNAELNGSGFIFAPFTDGETVFIPYDKAQIVVAEVKENDGTIANHARAPEINIEGKRDFEALVTKCIEVIKHNGFEKLVASRTETVETVSSVEGIYKKLLALYPNAFRYVFYSPLSGLWMGATPEQLLKVENNAVHTVALAGTQLYNPAETTVWEEKEQQEQLFVTNYIVNHLKPFSESVVTTEPYTFRAGGIVHIKTDISAELSETVSLADVIKTLHPTPAVCGLPKQQAKEWLLQNEGYNREYYSGFLGELNHDFATRQPKTDLFVNLRSMKLSAGNAQLFVGCGITKNSDPEKEFFETVNKSMTMRRAL